MIKPLEITSFLCVTTFWSLLISQKVCNFQSSKAGLRQQELRETNKINVNESVDISSTIDQKSVMVDKTVTYLFTYSMVKSPSRESKWFAASQEIPRISRNPKVHYRFFKGQDNNTADI